MDFMHSILALHDSLSGVSTQHIIDTAVGQVLHQASVLVMNNAPVLIMGSAMFNTVCGRKSPFPGPRKLRNYLKRHFLVLLVDEYNTSQLCPKCFKRLVRTKKNDVRHLHCTSCRPNPRIDPGDEDDVITNKRKTAQDYGRFMVHKDISAAMNMFSLAVAMIRTGQRPRQFCSARMVDQWTDAFARRKENAQRTDIARQTALSLVPQEDADTDLTSSAPLGNIARQTVRHQTDTNNNNNNHPTSVLLRGLQSSDTPRQRHDAAPRGSRLHHDSDSSTSDASSFNGNRLALNTGSPDVPLM